VTGDPMSGITASVPCEARGAPEPALATMLDSDHAMREHRPNG
jgi:hypothetical protein